MRVSWKHYRKNTMGFTLLELLVVIAIIGIISSATVVNLNQAKAKARDARRLSDITQLRKALEIYYYTVGEYPNAVDDPNTPNDDRCYGLVASALCTSLSATPQTAWIPDLTSQTGQLPIDPLNSTYENGTAEYAYIFTRYNATILKDFYYILYRLETRDDESECNGFEFTGWSCTGGGSMPQL